MSRSITIYFVNKKSENDVKEERDETHTIGARGRRTLYRYNWADPRVMVASLVVSTQDEYQQYLDFFKVFIKTVTVISDDVSARYGGKFVYALVGNSRYIFYQ